MLKRYAFILLLCLVGLQSCDSASVSSETVVNMKDLKFVDNYYYLSDSLYTGKVISESSLTPLIAKEIFSVTQGRIDGLYQQWTKEGNLRTESTYKAGIKDGSQKGYHLNGHLSYEYTVTNGKREGIYLEYYPSGDLQIENTYDKDSIIAQKIFDIDGVTLANYVIRDGRFYGFRGSSSCINVMNEKYIDN